ncbi:poly(beta-D-mannuronate) lyase [Reichenbachiella faecimaris]|uniref:Poly(Beta-D-mannuronate) lyase n=1 Tax=Reichenbachiella faecimaris TaxID=692418 RepID=A0A1W2G7J5_REIFA|nr:polysaccharide lyase 6 family protein [Reichenbachiella faecimaris]SMD32474.1 poly(beta-D-mannuronate) lyase [Reichenbachiella faecimaris]
MYNTKRGLKISSVAQSHFLFIIMILFVMFIVGCQTNQSSYQKVESADQLKTALAVANPGDTIVLANGEWKDAELVIQANGTKEAPIVVMAEKLGEVKLTGSSNLKLAGEFVVVNGLHFTKGYTPTAEVISFRIKKDQLANNCRITETLIDNYSNPERHESDYWVGMYGKNNRFDHNALVGKGNKGVTMAVRLNSEESLENGHLIDHNYFGPRENLGANGGETLRIGTSHYSLSFSNTQVINNYFDRCDGEHEIISNKSCGNLFKGNVFEECVGTLTFRHGNENTAESNAFFGNGKPHTGGIRVINEKQKVINNYGYGLTGHRFRGALVVMNGVPNSPINRYNQVIDSEINNNTFINCDYVQLCAGSDEERSAIPQTTSISNNIFWNEAKDDVFTVYDDISGISFDANILSKNIESIGSGFSAVNTELVQNEKGIYSLKDESITAGTTSEFAVVSKEATGPSWYTKPKQAKTFGYGRTIAVAAGEDLFDVMKDAKAGDVYTLSGDEYLLEKKIPVAVPITVQSKEGAVIKFEKSNLFVIENGGALQLDGLIIDGAECPDYAGNAVVSTSRYSMNRNYKLFINNCEFRDLDVNHSFNILKVYKNTFADSILIENSRFTDVSGTILELNQESDDIGIYNAEFVILTNNTFKNIGKEIVNLHRGGSDESTFGPLLFIDHCSFEKVGYGPKNKGEKSFTLHGVQKTKITNSVFDDIKTFDIYHTVGEPITKISDCSMKQSTLKISDQAALLSNLKLAKDANGSDGEKVGYKL